MQFAWAYGPAVAALLLGLVPFLRKWRSARAADGPRPRLDWLDATLAALLSAALGLQLYATSGRIAGERAREARARELDRVHREADRTREAREQERRRLEECASPVGRLAGARAVGGRVRVCGRDVEVPEGAAVTAGHFGDEPLRLRREGDRVLASLVVRDEEGGVRVALVDNEWFVGGRHARDKNFVADALEVLGDDDDPVFQIRSRGGEIRIAGVFYARDGGGPVSAGPWLHEIDGTGPTLFKYPGASHPGELNPADPAKSGPPSAPAPRPG